MTPKRRILVAGLFHETHSFVEDKTGLRDFAALRGEELLAGSGNSSPLGGALESAQQLGWEVVPTVDFRASPSGIVEHEVLDSWWREFESRARPQLENGLDAIYLVLHGAMITESCADVEGEILRRIRALPGAEGIRIFGVIDLHANFTAAMAASANCLVAYRENPHTDARQAAQIAMMLLARSFQTNQIPRMYWQHPPVIWPPTGTGTATEPMLSLEKMAREIENENQDIWSASVLAGFSFADIAETGVSFAVTTVGSEAVARMALAKLSQLAIKSKDVGICTETPVDSIVEKLVPQPPGLTVLVEPSDNIGGGAPGDGTGLLRSLVKHKIKNAAVALNDPHAVNWLQRICPGQRTSLALGGKGSWLDEGPLSLEVEFVSRSQGRFQLEDKQSHLASMVGDTVDMGPSVVVRHNGISILLTSRKTPPFDLGQWRSQGIEPRELSVIGVKAAVAHRRAYDPIAQRMFWVDTPGPCSSNLKSLPYRQVKRPVYPLDDV